MYDKKGGFALRLRNLFGLFEDFFVHDACRDVIGIVGMATTSMSYPQIKTLSHKGAIYVEKRWSDPGNFVYTVWWTIWGMMARQLTRRPLTRIQANWERTRRTACKVTEVQRMVRERWTRDPDTARYLELIGDLMELSLGTGYIDQQRYWRIIAKVSPIIEEIRQTLLFLDHGARQAFLQGAMRSTFEEDFRIHVQCDGGTQIRHPRIFGRMEWLLTASLAQQTSLQPSIIQQFISVPSIGWVALSLEYLDSIGLPFSYGLRDTVVS